MTDWDKIRKQFPAATASAYLNTASSGAVLKASAEAGKRYYDDVLMHGDSLWNEWLLSIEAVREKVARLINADKEEIAFIHNTSCGMSYVALMLKGKGSVVTMDDEFPSSTLPWINQGFSLNFAMPENEIYSAHLIDKYVDKKTEIVVTSHVQSFTGFRQDLEVLGKYCKDKDLIYVVNATQSIGALPIDVKKANIDFLVFSSVKWLMTGEGIGAIYISKKWHSKVKWPIAGWLAMNDTDKFDNRHLDFKNSASALEIGAQPIHSILALGKAIDFVEGIGVQNIENRLSSLTDYLLQSLDDLEIAVVSNTNKKYRSSIIAVKMENAKDVARRLLEKKIIVSERRGVLRISLHIYNNRKDIDKLIHELKNLTNKNKSIL